jgi:uncharacterized protein (TIGR03437 family)
VDLRSRLISSVLPLVFLTSVSALAAPKLRLDTTAIGPVSFSQGANGVTQSITAINAGDGALNLTAKSNAAWLSPAVQAQTQCGFVGPCIKINLALNTASLAKGTYTGVVTISDPNAVDAPQTVTVTVAAGGGVPDSMSLYVTKTGEVTTQQFTTAVQVNARANAPANGPSLSVSLSNTGSFQTTVSYAYNVSSTASSSVPEGAYNGSIVLSGSPVAAENKTVPVTLNVTSKPVAQFTTPNTFRVAQGATKQTQYLIADPLGSGTFTLSGVTAATTTGGNWLSGAVVGPYVGITADPAGLDAGVYQGKITIASNAANASVDVPVQLEVVASGAPVVYYKGVKSNATFTPEVLAQGDLPAVFGEQFTTGDQQVAAGAPWPTTLGGATVFINDQPVPLYYVSQTQINFQVPFEVSPGEAVLRVDRDGQRGNSVSVTIAARAAKLLIATNAAGDAVTSTPRIPVSNGVVSGGPGVPVKAGDALVIYALGLGQTTPALATGQVAGSNPLPQVLGSNLVKFGASTPFSPAVSQIPLYVGATPGYVGLYQINVVIPNDAPRGAAIPVQLQSDGGTSNTLLFNIQ